MRQVVERAVEVLHRRIDHADNQVRQHRHRQQRHDHRADGQPQRTVSVIALVHRQAADALAQGLFHLAHQVNALGGEFKPRFRLDAQRLAHRHLEPQALQLADFDHRRALHLLVELLQRRRRGLAPEGIVVGRELAEVATEARQQCLIETPLVEHQAEHHPLAAGALFHLDELIQRAECVNDGGVVDAGFQGVGVANEGLNDLGVTGARLGAVDAQLIDLPTDHRQLIQCAQHLVQLPIARRGQAAHHLDRGTGVLAHLRHALAHGLATAAQEHPAGAPLTLQGGDQLAQLLGRGAGGDRRVHITQRLVVVHHKHPGQDQKPQQRQ